MSRFSLMTWGVLLILIGVELNLVDSVVLTPRATKFWNSKVSYSPFENDGGTFASNDGPFSLASERRIAPGQSFSDQYRARNSFPYSTPNYRRSRNDGRGIFGNGLTRNAGFRNSANSLAEQVGIANQKKVSPPSWWCWPPIFLGAVLFLFGAARGGSGD